MSRKRKKTFSISVTDWWDFPDFFFWPLWLGRSKTRRERWGSEQISDRATTTFSDSNKRHVALQQTDTRPTLEGRLQSWRVLFWLQPTSESLKWIEWWKSWVNNVGSFLTVSPRLFFFFFFVFFFLTKRLAGDGWRVRVEPAGRLLMRSPGCILPPLLAHSLLHWLVRFIRPASEPDCVISLAGSINSLSAEPCLLASRFRFVTQTPNSTEHTINRQTSHATHFSKR